MRPMSHEVILPRSVPHDALLAASQDESRELRTRINRRRCIGNLAMASGQAAFQSSECHRRQQHPRGTISWFSSDDADVEPIIISTWGRLWRLPKHCVISKSRHSLERNCCLVVTNELLVYKDLHRVAFDRSHIGIFKDQWCPYSACPLLVQLGRHFKVRLPAQRHRYAWGRRLQLDVDAQRARQCPPTPAV